MWISSAHVYMLGFPCLMQFGEGENTYIHKKRQPEVCRSLEAAQGRENPALAPARVSQADFLSALWGAAAGPVLWGRLEAQQCLQCFTQRVACAWLLLCMG